ncbi:MAG: carboxypeptidase regulatory-like domain-containing protein [Lewinellaceae bacterium]|nr:carboxypeptidase regulatory-like domain-containing protein [Lewinellaceae bacterium]
MTPSVPCPAVTNDLLITIYDAPQVDAVPNQQICSGVDVQLNGIIGGSATSSTWVTSGDGTFANSNALSTIYTPGPTDILVGSVTLELFTNNPFGPCPAESDQLVIVIFRNPTANAGPDQDICEDEVASISGSVAGGATSGSWSTSGDGTFGNANALTTTYTPGANDITAGTVTLTLTTDDPAGPCTPGSDDLILTISSGTPTATVDNGTACSEDSPYTAGTDNVLDLNTLITSGPTTGTWADTDNTGGLSGSIFTATLGMEGQSFQFTYTIPGVDGPGNGACNDKVYVITVTVEDCFASIGDYVWEDTNGNGIQDDGPTGIPGVTVTLTGTTTVGGLPINDNTTTDANGNYEFTLLPPGDYKLTFSTPAGYTFTDLDAGGDDTTDSDADPNNGGMTVFENLVAGEDNPTYDAGLVQEAFIGDYVWEDTDGDGVQDGNEPPIPGVTVNLYEDNNQDGVPDGAPIATDVTDANGEYGFPVDPGSYVVEFVTPPGYTGSPQDQGGDDTVDSDPDPNTGLTGTITVNSGDNDDTNDAGYYEPASLGDYVWLDTNANGIQDDGPTGIAGVTVNLYADANQDGVPDGPALGTTTTDPSGFYQFTGLAPGDYVVEFINPGGGLLPSPQDQGGDDTIDSDADPNTGLSHSINLESGENDPTIDAGYYESAFIGDFVWQDTDGDGIQDAGEPGIPGVTVNLYADANQDGVPDGAPIATDVTDANGEYGFPVDPGSYVVEFVTPGGFDPTGQDQGGDDTVDSDPDPNTGLTGTITVNSGDNDDTNDAGYYEPASLGDFVWLDGDADGIQDAGEPGIANVTVNLYADANQDGFPDGASIGTATTDGTGFYQFTGLAPGDYVVEFINPGGGLLPSPQDQGGDDTIDSDADPNTGLSHSINLESGENDPTIDAGYYESAFIGDFVWQDTDGDGIQDAGEPGIPGVTVNLYEDANQDGVPDGAPIATDVTDGNGEYGFPVDPGSYVVEFVTPAGFDPTGQDQGGDDTVDSDPDPNTGLTGTVTVNSGETDLTVDAGYYEPASLGDFVWSDTDADGIQDAGEPGIGGVTVNLLDGGGAFLASTTTAPDGSYSFTNLAPGDYIVEFIGPAGFAPSPQDQGGDDTIDSDANPGTGQTGIITLSSGENDPTNDAGYYESAFIGDFVWQDTDGDGIQDAGEPGIPGVTVNLYADANQDGVPDGAPIATDVTGANGEYGFPVDPGSYVVEFVTPAGFDGTPQDQGGDDTVDSDADPNTGLTGTITVNSGETDLTNDAGFYEPASLGDFVWSDTDADGIQDAGEPGIGGVTVNLLDGGGAFLASTTTAPDGSYSFTNLAPGDYIVEFIGPAGFAPSPQDQGGDDTIDSDANPGTGQTGIITLSSGENDPTNDAGYYESAFIGDFVWQDTDGDGIQDAGEPGIPGVTVNLYADNNQDGVPDGAPIATDVTGANGEYGFPVDPGSYVVEFVTPGGFDGTPQDQGGDDTADSDADPNTGLTGTITVNSGETDLTNDAGFYEPASLGDFVWSDTDADGIQDAGEPGIGGVTVNLLDGGGAFLRLHHDSSP